MEIVLILYNIRSLYNVGSIFRTADGAGVEKIYLCGITPEPVDRFGKIRPQLAKVALGAEKSVKWEYVKSAAKLIDKLRRPKGVGGYKILAVEQDKKSVLYFKYKVKNRQLDKIAVMLGNEVRGLPPAILKKADKILEIHMSGKKESLNVSVAAGVMLYGLRYGLNQ